MGQIDRRFSGAEGRVKDLSAGSSGCAPTAPALWLFAELRSLLRRSLARAPAPGRQRAICEENSGRSPERVSAREDDVSGSAAHSPDLSQVASAKSSPAAVP